MIYEHNERDFLKKISQTITALRKERNLTQVQLAEICGLHTNTIKGVERPANCNPRLHTLWMIASGLGVSIDTLLGRQDMVSHQPQADKEEVSADSATTATSNPGLLARIGGVSIYRVIDHEAPGGPAACYLTVSENTHAPTMFCMSSRSNQ